MKEYTQPLSFYLDNNTEALTFHLLDVGQGLMSLIVLPDETTILYDCNVTEDTQERILNYLGTHIPRRLNISTNTFEQWIDIFVCSHRDDDHIRGLDKVNEQFIIKSIWDSNQSGDSCGSYTYQYYMRLRLAVKKKYGNNSLYCPKASTGPILEKGGAKIYCLSPHANGEYAEEETKTQHTKCIVLSVKYAAKSILLTGDSDWCSWRDYIIPEFEHTDILKSEILVASHHGSRSFFSETSVDDGEIDVMEFSETTYLEALEFIKPKITLVSCGEYKEPHKLPNEEAIQLYIKHTTPEDKQDEGQVYTTYDKGSLVGFIRNDSVLNIIPVRFQNTNVDIFDFKIKCVSNELLEILHKGIHSVPKSLDYSIVNPKNGVLDPIDKIQVQWEVSNCGIDEHEEHKEIYYKSDKANDEKLKYSRRLEYKGKHLLRCSIKNRNKNADITRIFILTGI